MRERSGDWTWRPKDCAKGSKESGEEGGGCSSADVARERVSCRMDSEEGRCRCRRLESCVFVEDAEGAYEVLRDNAGQSHGNVNWSERVVGVLKAFLRSFRPAARESIFLRASGPVQSLWGVSNEQTKRNKSKTCKRQKTTRGNRAVAARTWGGRVVASWLKILHGNFGRPNPCQRHHRRGIASLGSVFA